MAHFPKYNSISEVTLLEITRAYKYSFMNDDLVWHKVSPRLDLKHRPKNKAPSQITKKSQSAPPKKSAKNSAKKSAKK